MNIREKRRKLIFLLFKQRHESEKEIFLVDVIP